jgi:hypothetical protein
LGIKLAGWRRRKLELSVEAEVEACEEDMVTMRERGDEMGWVGWGGSASGGWR